MTNPMPKKQICIVGGGATGVALLWCLTSQEKTRDAVELTLLHEDDRLGGHSHTEYPVFGGKQYPVDVGVQYICPLLYPNTYKMLERPEFADVKLQDAKVALSATFTEKLNWGNIPAYQKGSYFDALYTPANVGAAKDFVDAVELALIEGRFDQTIGNYLKTHPLPSDFVSYFLMPYLSVFNGYGDDNQLMLATFEDLFPLFTPLFQPGPLAAFAHPGLGWQRFANGSSAWIDAMAAYATGPHGATVHTGAHADAVWPDPSGNGVWVSWTPPGQQPPPPQKFDAVILTTDMTTNRALLNNPKNPYYDSPDQPVTQAKFISEAAFPLNPGSCYIHQDASVLAPYLQGGPEVVQFVAYYSQTPNGGLPYDMSTTYSTYFAHNMVPGGIPEPVYVTMYGALEAPKPPARQLFPPVPWRHGRFLGSFMYTSKQNLHHIQGLGDVWFAGNNTTLDSEEGALVSAMVIAGHDVPGLEVPVLRDRAAQHRGDDHVRADEAQGDVSGRAVRTPGGISGTGSSGACRRTPRAVPCPCPEHRRPRTSIQRNRGRAARTIRRSTLDRNLPGVPSMITPMRAWAGAPRAARSSIIAAARRRGHGDQ
jgi:hypothetical protein